MKKQDKDMNMMHKHLEKQINQNYKISFWSKLRNAIEGFAVFVLIMILLLSILALLITLIESPVSLAILCATILIIIIWWTK